MRSSILLILFAAASAHAQTRPATLEVTSKAFTAQHAIPRDFTCDGRQISPPLAWSSVPAGTQSIAIVVDDPDAPKGTFTHWIVTDIPPTTRSLPAGGALPPGAMTAKNDAGKTGFAPPCPPSGSHRYRFRVFALDTKLGRAASKAELEAAMSGHVIGYGELVGTYQRTAMR